MLSLLSFVLLVAAIGLLAVGVVVADSLAPLVASVGLSALAGILLWLGARSSSPPPPGMSAPDDADGAEPEVDDETVFPIADYDELDVDEVVGLLPQLYSDELDVVEARERQGRARAAVLAKLAELRVIGTEADAALHDGTPAAEAPLAELLGAELAVSELVGRLGALDEQHLSALRAHEIATSNRRTVLVALDRRLAGHQRAGLTQSD